MYSPQAANNSREQEQPPLVNTDTEHQVTTETDRYHHVQTQENKLSSQATVASS